MKEFIVFRVKDTGIGIDPENLPYLFQPFVQANRDDRGIGLGLSKIMVLRLTLDFVKQFADAMGGFTFAKSKGKGFGASFYVCLPNSKADSERLQEDVCIANETKILKKANSLKAESASKQEEKIILFAEVQYLSHLLFSG